MIASAESISNPWLLLAASCRCQKASAMYLSIYLSTYPYIYMYMYIYIYICMYIYIYIYKIIILPLLVFCFWPLVACFLVFVHVHWYCLGTSYLECCAYFCIYVRLLTQSFQCDQWSPTFPTPSFIDAYPANSTTFCPTPMNQHSKPSNCMLSPWDGRSAPMCHASFLTKLCIEH